jgi:hypothetical protein
MDGSACCLPFHHLYHWHTPPHHVGGSMLLWDLLASVLLRYFLDLSTMAIVEGFAPECLATWMSPTEKKLAWCA